MTNRPRILILTQMFPSEEFPALGTFVAQRAKALAPYADVRVMAPTPYFPPLPGFGRYSRLARVERTAVTDDGAMVFYPRYFVWPKMASWIQGYTMSVSSQKEFGRRCGSWGWWPDVIDAHLAFPDGYCAVQLAKKLGCHCIVTCHGSDLMKVPSKVLARRLLRRGLGGAGRVIAVSPYLRERAVALGCPPRRALVLPNAVDTDKFAPFDAISCRARLGLERDRPIALSVARLDDNKNQIVLIRALAAMSQEGHCPIRLVLVGTGPSRERLSREARMLGVGGGVTFAGQRPHDEIPYWMSAADWIVLSSRSEGWPTVYFEAMACGKPVLSSHVESAKWAIPDDRFGLPVDPNTPRGWQDAFTRAQRGGFDALGLRRYALEHSWDNWAKTYLNILDELLFPRLEQERIA